MVELPYTPTMVSHRHGGTVLEITAIQVRMEKPRGGLSRDRWLFVGNVSWDDCREGKDEHIDLSSLCSSTDAGMAEIKELSALMSAYLAENGEWCEGKPHRGWFAHRKPKAGPEQPKA